MGQRKLRYRPKTGELRHRAEISEEESRIKLRLHPELLGGDKELHSRLKDASGHEQLKALDTERIRDITDGLAYDRVHGLEGYYGDRYQAYEGYDNLERLEQDERILGLTLAACVEHLKRRGVGWKVPKKLKYDWKSHKVKLPNGKKALAALSVESHEAFSEPGFEGALSEIDAMGGIVAGVSRMEKDYKQASERAHKQPEPDCSDAGIDDLNKMMAARKNEIGTLYRSSSILGQQIVDGDVKKITDGDIHGTEDIAAMASVVAGIADSYAPIAEKQARINRLKRECEKIHEQQLRVFREQSGHESSLQVRQDLILAEDRAQRLAKRFKGAGKWLFKDRIAALEAEAAGLRRWDVGENLDFRDAEEKRWSGGYDYVPKKVIRAVTHKLGERISGFQEALNVQKEGVEGAEPLDDKTVTELNEEYIKTFVMPEIEDKRQMKRDLVAAGHRKYQDDLDVLTDEKQVDAGLDILREGAGISVYTPHAPTPVEDQEKAKELQERVLALPHDLREVVERHLQSIRDSPAHIFRQMADMTAKGFLNDRQLRMRAGLEDLYKPFTQSSTNLGVYSRDGPRTPRIEPEYWDVKKDAEDLPLALWETFRDSPSMQKRFGKAALDRVDTRLGFGVIAALTETNEGSERSLLLGDKLFSFKSAQMTPMTIANSFREQGVSGGFPFVLGGNFKPEESKLAGYVSSLTPEKIEEIRQMGIPGLMKVISVVKNHPTDFYDPVDGPKNPNSPHSEVQAGLGQMAAHYLTTAKNDNYIKFASGLIKQLDTDLPDEVYATLRGTFDDFWESGPCHHVLDVAEHRVLHKKDVKMARMLADVFLNGNYHGEPWPEHSRKSRSASIFTAFIESDFTEADQEMMSKLSGKSKEELVKARDFIREVHEIPNQTNPYEYSSYEGKEQFEAFVALGEKPEYIETIRELAEYGYSFDWKHKDVLPEIHANKDAIVAAIKDIRVHWRNDYEYRPDARQVSTDDPNTHRDTFIIDPYHTVATSHYGSAGQEFGTLCPFEPTKDWEVPKIKSRAILRTIMLTDPTQENPIDGWVEVDPETEKSFHTALSRFTSEARKQESIIPVQEFIDLIGNPYTTYKNIWKSIEAGHEPHDMIAALKDSMPYYTGAMEQMKEDKTFSFLKPKKALSNLPFDMNAMRKIKDLDYPPAFLFGVILAHESHEITPEFLDNLSTFIPRGSRLVKDKYNLEFLTSYIQANPQTQTGLLKNLQKRFGALPRGSEEKLLTQMSLVNALADKGITERINGQVLDEENISFDDVYTASIQEAAEVLGGVYPKDLIAKMPHRKLARWIDVYGTYENTFRHFKDEESIPVMRAIAVVELMGAETAFRQNDPDLLDDLEENAETYFPVEEERKEVLEYLKKRRNASDVKRVFPEDRYSKEKRRELLAAWNDPGDREEHILLEVCIDDRIASAKNILTDLFIEKHFSDAFTEMEHLKPGEENPLKTLAQQWQAIQWAKEELSGGGETKGKKKKKTPPAMRKTVDDIKRSVGHLTPEEQQSELSRRQEETKAEQKQMKEWEPLRTLGLKFEEKLGGHADQLAGARRELGKHSSLIEDLGFEFTESFRDKVYRGELDILEKTVEAEKKTAGEGPRKKELEELTGIIGSITKTSQDAEQYLGEVTTYLKEILPKMEEKQTRVQDMKAAIHQDASSDNMLSAIEEKDPRFASYVEKRLGQEPGLDEAGKRDLVTYLLNDYEDTTAIGDLRNIIGAAEAEKKTEPQVYTYAGEHVFSRVLQAFRGQCLDYRTSHNSIGNSVYNISLQDPVRQAIVARDQDGLDRFDAIAYLAPVRLEGSEAEQPAVVLDRPYVPDGSVTSWSKIAGEVKWGLMKAKKMGIPLVVPDNVYGQHRDQFLDLLEVEGYDRREESTPTITLLPGPSGATYCELADYTHYEVETNKEHKATVIPPIST